MRVELLSFFPQPLSGLAEDAGWERGLGRGLHVRTGNGAFVRDQAQ